MVSKQYGLTYEQMEEFVKTVRLPMGQELFDRRTYRIEPLYYLDLSPKFRKDVGFYKKVLILSDGCEQPIGAVFFTDDEIFVMYTLEEYRNQKYMATICQNGVLRSECGPHAVTIIPTDNIVSFEYFQMIHHMLLCAGVRIYNLDSCFQQLLKVSPEVEGTYGENYESFVAAYGVDAAYERLVDGTPLSKRLANAVDLILYDNRTKLISVTDDRVVFEYRPAKDLVIRMGSFGPDVVLGLFTIDANFVGRGSKLETLFQSDHAQVNLLMQHIPWNNLPAFLKYFVELYMECFNHGILLKRDSAENREARISRFQAALAQKFDSNFFEYIRDFR